MSNELVQVKSFVLMDAEDEKQILAEMRGEIIKTYIYRYSDGGHTVEGLSKAGVDAVAMEMAIKGKPLRVLEQSVVEDPKYIKVIVKVGRYIVGKDGTESLLDTTLGTKRQAKFYPNGRENPFAYEQAIVKAERNGKRKLMPEKIILEMMKLYKSQGRTQEVRNPEKVNPKSISQQNLKTGAKSEDGPNSPKTQKKKTSNAVSPGPVLDLPDNHDIDPKLVELLTESWSKTSEIQHRQVLDESAIANSMEIKTHDIAGKIYNRLEDLREGRK